ncbi:MAG: TraR/DksA C4-type zinc finger protein [Acidimicrobiia bacterium]
MERLLAVPQTPYCVACQQRREGEDGRSAVL